MVQKCLFVLGIIFFLCDYHWFQGDSVKVTFIGANPRNNVKVPSFLPLVIFFKAYFTVRKCNLFTNLCVPYISVGGHLPVSGDASTRQQLEGGVYRQSVGNKVSPNKDCNSFANSSNNLFLSSFNSYIQICIYYFCRGTRRLSVLWTVYNGIG